jgi:type I restriction enzyme S subunit
MNYSINNNVKWPLSNLGTVVKFLSGGTPKKDEEKYWNGNIPWVSSGEMSEARIQETKLNVTTDGVLNGTKLAPKNTIFVVVRGMSLAKEFRVSLAMREMTFNQDVKAIYPSDSINSIFLFYYLKSQSNPIRDSASEAAHGTKKLDMPVLEQWPVPLPKLVTQKKIAAILSSYDDLIENNKRRIALLENMAEEIYREWFVRFRFPGYQTAEFEKGVPKGWKYEKLDDICCLIKRGISPKYDDDSSNLVINQKCIRNNRIDLSVARHHDSKVSKEKFIEFGDALVNSTGVGTLGRVSVVEFEPENITVDSHVTICRANKGKVNPVYLGNTITKLKNYFEFMAAGSTGQVELNRTLIAGIKVLVPEPELMNEFEQMIKNIIQQKQYLFTINENLVSTKNQLLPRLISGKLSVENMDIQFPPSMLENEAIA